MTDDLNIGAIITPQLARADIDDMKATIAGQAPLGIDPALLEAAKHACAIGNPGKLSEDVYLRVIYSAFVLSPTLEGFASRFVLHHSHYVRYWHPIRSWVAYVKDGKDFVWRPCPQLNIQRLLVKTIRDAAQELDLVQAAKDAGSLDAVPRATAVSLTSIIGEMCRTEPLQHDILNALKVVLRQGYQRTGNPITPADAKIGRALLGKTTKKAQAELIGLGV